MMPRWLHRLLGGTPKRYDHNPGPTQRAKDRERIMEKMREMRYSMGMEWK